MHAAAPASLDCPTGHMEKTTAPVEGTWPPAGAGRHLVEPGEAVEDGGMNGHSDRATAHVASTWPPAGAGRQRVKPVMITVKEVSKMPAPAPCGEHVAFGRRRQAAC